MSSDSSETDRQQREFFFKIGYAITRWANVDRELFKLCRYALGTNDVKAAAVFFRSPNMSEHLALVDGLMMTSVGRLHLKQWEAIHKKLDKLLKYRNYIAHYPVDELAGVSLTINFKSPQGGFSDARMLQESYMALYLRTDPNRLLKPNEKSKKLEIEDILGHINDVENIMNELNELAKILPEKALTLPPESPQRSSSQPSGSERTSARTRAKRQPRPRSSPE